jgi:hypothetical protein
MASFLATDMMRQLEKVEPGAGRAYLDWLAEAKTSLEVRRELCVGQPGITSAAPCG